MSIKDQLRTDLTAAMRERDEVVVSTLRLALAAVTNAETAGDDKRVLSDDEVVALLASEAKKRTEAAEAYESGGRPERAAAELAQRAVLERYLPAAVDDETLAAVVAEEVAAAAASGHEGPKATGVVIKAVRSRLGPTVDGGRVAAAVKSAL